MLFGRNDQAKIILKETFGSTHFAVEGPDNNSIDCMFFPCTQKEKVVIDNETSIKGTPVNVKNSMA